MSIEDAAYSRMVELSSLWDGEGDDDARPKEINHLTQTRFTFRLGGFWFFLRQR